jgi:tetratricopeptide (TPR) repeat protein
MNPVHDLIPPGCDTGEHATADRLPIMARKHRRDLHRRDLPPGHPDFLPLTDTERRAHADALVTMHEGHGCEEHAAALCQAAEYYAMLDEHDLAEKLFRQALADGGPVPGSVHGFYASFLFDRARHAEALELIGQARRLDPDDPDMFNVIGETLLANGYERQAARWFTNGLVHQIGHLTDLTIHDLRTDRDLADMVRGRHQARQSLELEPDHLDELAQQLIADIRTQTH